MAAVGHIARAADPRRRNDHPAAGVRSVSELDAGRRRDRRSDSARARLRVSDDAVIAAVTPRTRMIFLNTPNNPTGQLIPIADLRRIADAAPRRRRARRRGVHRVRRHAFLPELPRLPERARRPHVLEGARARRHARRRPDRAAGGPRPGACRHAAASTSTRVAIAATLAALEDPSSCRGTPRRSRSRASGSTPRATGSGSSYWESAANFVLVRVGDTVDAVVEALAAAASTCATARRIRRRPDASASRPAWSSTPTRPSRRWSRSCRGKDAR